MAYNFKLKNDIIFKAFFSRHQNYLESFLNAILNRKIKIKKILHDVRLEQLTRDMKYGVLDLEVILETDRVITSHKDHTINNDVKYYYIELDKFRNQNPDMKDTLNQWLSFLDMERSDLLEMAKEENKEIKEAFEEYEVLTGDAEVKRLAELKRMSELEEHSALTVAKQEGIQEGEKSGIKKGRKIRY